MDNGPEVNKPPSKRRQIGFWGLLAIGIAGLFIYHEVFGPDMENQGAVHPAVGLPLLALKLQGLTEGTDAVTMADIKGKVVLLNFWGVWCGPCQIELPHIVDLYNEFLPRTDFKLLAVSCGSQSPSDETIKELRHDTNAYLDREHLVLPSYADADAVTRSAVATVAEMDRFAYPTTVLLDRKGIIRGVWLGYRSGADEEMKRLIGKVLEEKE